MLSVPSKHNLQIMFPSDAHALTKFYCITTELSERHTTIPEQSRRLTTQLCREKRSYANVRDLAR